MYKTEPRKNRKLYRQIVSLWLGLWLVTPAGAFALPGGESVLPGGSATITRTTPGDMLIQQTTPKVAIEWQSFNIGATETVHFQQPSVNSVAFNRVVGADPSVILGQLSSNGQVFLSNPSGVVFGQGSRVDVHGLLATTLDITDTDFFNANNSYQFSQGANPSLAAVINNGNLNAKSYVSLIASAVQNNGTLDNNGSYVDGRIIVADLGYVALGSGTMATLDFNGDGLISFAVDGEVSGSVTDTQGNVIGDRINNTGLIRANGGQVLLTAQSARNFIGNVINHTGVIEAQTVLHEDGKIILSSVDQVDSFSASEGDVRAEVMDAPPVEYRERPRVLVQKRGQINLIGGRQGDVKVSGTLDASQVLVTAGSANNGSGTVTVSAGEKLTTNNGNISILADDLVLEGDLDAGTGDVFYIPAGGGNLTLSPDGSMGADIGGNDLSHITAKNLGLGTTGNIIVKGMNEEATQGISGSVFLVSGGNIIFNVGDSVFSALNLSALNNVNVNANVTTTRGDIRITSNGLDLSADLNSGTNDVAYTHLLGGDLNLAPGNPNGGLGGDDLGHIYAENLILKTLGDINVDGITENNTAGIKNSVILDSGRDINFKGADSVFPTLQASAVNDINVNTNVTTTQSDFTAVADSDVDGKGDLNIAPGIVIASARDIDVSATNINADTDESFEETRDLILNGDVIMPEPPTTPLPVESISQGSLGTFLTEFLENGGSSDGC